MCGKVCTRECEAVCSMGLQGEPVAIRWPKRYATERFDELKPVLDSGLPAGRLPLAHHPRAAGLDTGPAHGLSSYEIQQQAMRPGHDVAGPPVEIAIPGGTNRC